jgi:hypothetical protein
LAPKPPDPLDLLGPGQGDIRIIDQRLCFFDDLEVNDPVDFK